MLVKPALKVAFESRSTFSHRSLVKAVTECCLLRLVFVSKMLIARCLIKSSRIWGLRRGSKLSSVMCVRMWNRWLANRRRPILLPSSWTVTNLFVYDRVKVRYASLLQLLYVVLQCPCVSTVCDASWSASNFIRFVFIREFNYCFIPLQQPETVTEKCNICVVRTAANDLKSFNRSIETVRMLINPFIQNVIPTL